MSHRTLKTAAFTLLAFVTVQHAFAQCTTRAVTNIVYVTFSACKPADTITVLIGGEPVLLNRIDPKTWRGETENTFTLNERALEVDDADIPSIRFACSTPATPRDAGECVAHYHVSCEELWHLEVKKVPETAKATISYVRNPPPKMAVTPCNHSVIVKGRIEIDLGRKESVVVKVDQPRLDIPVDLRSFRKKKELTLDDVVPSARSELAAIQANPAMRALTKSLIVDAMTDLLFTKKDY